MITIQVVGRGSNFYFKKKNSINFSVADFIAQNGEDCRDWVADETDLMISLESGIKIYVSESNKDVDFFKINDCFATDSILNISTRAGSSWRKYAKAVENDLVIIWGNSGVIGLSHTFEDESSFDVSKLLVFSFKMPDLDSNGEKRYFGGIKYNRKEPNKVGTNFEPKYGFWEAMYLHPK